MKRVIRWYGKVCYHTTYLTSFTADGAPNFGRLEDAANYDTDEKAIVALKACRRFHGPTEEIVLVRIERVKRRRPKLPPGPLVTIARDALDTEVLLVGGARARIESVIVMYELSTGQWVSRDCFTLAAERTAQPSSGVVNDASRTTEKK